VLEKHHVFGKPENRESSNASTIMATVEEAKLDVSNFIYDINSLTHI
jgi:hypothetical protein